MRGFTLDGHRVPTLYRSFRRHDSGFILVKISPPEAPFLATAALVARLSASGGDILTKMKLWLSWGAGALTLMMH